MEIDSSPRLTGAPKAVATGRTDDAPDAAPTPSVEAQKAVSTQAEAMPPPAPRAAPSALRIGVFEDSYSTLRLVMSALKERGHQVDHIASLDDASDALGRGQYDALIVSDTMVGGAEACQSVIARVRSGPDRVAAALPIVALTLRGDASRRRVLKLLGASATVSDPTERRLVAALSAALDRDAPAAPQPVKSRVLLLEDSYSVSLLLSDALARGGRAVDHFATPDQVIAALEEDHYEAVVLSQNDQPGQLSCVQLLEYTQLRGRRGTTGPRVIVLTDNSAPENVNELLRAGAERVLPKNDTAQLGDLILNLLEIRTPAQPGMAAKDNTPLRAEGRAVAAPFAPPRSSRPAVAALAIGLLLAGGWFSFQFFSAKPRVNVVSAELDSVARVLPASGNVVSKRELELAPALTGQLYHVYVNEGELVRKGETLATLDNREATINVRRAEAQVFRFRTELNLANKAITALRAQAGPDGSQQALLQLEKERALAAAKLRVAEEDQSAAQLALERLSIVAPFAGVLLQSFAIEGKWVEAGVPVYTLSDLDTQEVLLRVDADAAAEVVPGQTVQLTADGALGEEWEEKVLRVVSDTRTAEGAIKRRTALVYASLGENAPLLQFGRRVNAQITTDTVNSAIAVPLDALLLRDDKNYVALVNNKRITFRPVEVGLRSLTKAEIRGGLVPGETVVLSARGLTDGQRVDIDMVD